MKKASFQPSVLPSFSTILLLIAKHNLFGNSSYACCKFALDAAVGDTLRKAAFIYKEVVYARLHIGSRAILVAIISGNEVYILLARHLKAVTDRGYDNIAQLLGEHL